MTQSLGSPRGGAGVCSWPGALTFSWRNGFLFCKDTLGFPVNFHHYDRLYNGCSFSVDGWWPLVPVGGAHWRPACDFCFQGCLLMTNVQVTTWTWGATIVGRPDLLPALTAHCDLHSRCSSILCAGLSLPGFSVLLTSMHSLPGSSHPGWIIPQGQVHQQGCPALPSLTTRCPCLNSPGGAAPRNYTLAGAISGQSFLIPACSCPVGVVSALISLEIDSPYPPNLFFNFCSLFHYRGWCFSVVSFLARSTLCPPLAEMSLVVVAAEKSLFHTGLMGLLCCLLVVVFLFFF